LTLCLLDWRLLRRFHSDYGDLRYFRVANSIQSVLRSMQSVAIFLVLTRFLFAFRGPIKEPSFCFEFSVIVSAVISKPFFSFVCLLFSILYFCQSRKEKKEKKQNFTDFNKSLYSCHPTDLESFTLELLTVNMRTLNRSFALYSKSIFTFMIQPHTCMKSQRTFV